MSDYIGKRSLPISARRTPKPTAIRSDTIQPLTKDNINVNIDFVRTVVFYREASGKCPIEEFLDELPSKDAQKVVWVLQLIEELDVLPGTYFKKLVSTEGIWEIRARLGSNAYRLLCFVHGNNVVVLTNGFRKKTQKTPRTEIRLAESRMADWQRRNG